MTRRQQVDVNAHTSPFVTQILDAADTLENVAARLRRQAMLAPSALMHVAEELVTLGYPSSSGGGSERVSGGGAELTPVERAASVRFALTAIREDIRDAVRNTLNQAKRMAAEADVNEMLLRQAQSFRVSDADRDEIVQEWRNITDDGAPKCNRVIYVDDRGQPCPRPVEHFVRNDGTVGFRSSGICAACRQADIRAARAEREGAA